jgi:ketosteroid isomerase-like protein
MIVHHAHSSAQATTVQALFQAIEAGDLASLEALYADELLQVEHPNRLVPAGARRTKAQVLEAARRGLSVMRSQEYQIDRWVVEGDAVAVQCRWEGIVAVDLPSLGLRAGDAMHAQFAQFILLAGGRIVLHHTYDCFVD